MNNQVRVTASPEGDVIIKNDDGMYGYIRVVQQRQIVDDSTGWLKIKGFSALVHGTVKDLESLEWYDGMTLPGTIIIREQLTPFNKKNPDKDFKIAGETGVVCKSGDQPIYRNTYYSPNPNAADVTIPHTNGDEIKAAYAKEVSEDKADFSL